MDNLYGCREAFKRPGAMTALCRIFHESFTVVRNTYSCNVRLAVHPVVSDTPYKTSFCDVSAPTSSEPLGSVEQEKQHKYSANIEKQTDT